MARAIHAGAAQGAALGTSDLNTRRDRAKERSLRERNATRADLTAKINGALATMKIAELPDEVKLDAYNNIYSPAMAELTGSPVAKASNWGVPLLKSVEEITKLLNSKGSPKDIRAGIGEFGRKNKGNQQFVDTYFGDNVKRLDETIAANDKAEFDADVDFFNQQAGIQAESGNYLSNQEGEPSRETQNTFHRINTKEGGAYGQRVANTAQVIRSEREREAGDPKELRAGAADVRAEKGLQLREAEAGRSVERLTLQKEAGKRAGEKTTTLDFAKRAAGIEPGASMKDVTEQQAITVLENMGKAQGSTMDDFFSMASDAKNNPNIPKRSGFWDKLVDMIKNAGPPGGDPTIESLGLEGQAQDTVNIFTSEEISELEGQSRQR